MERSIEKKKILMSLKEKDNVEKWEDEVLETKRKELNAVAGFRTNTPRGRSEPNQRDIREIVQIAEGVSAMSISRPI
jgi:hypothetical protein